MTHQPILICVLGMHRSGTSCLTGSLQTAGVQLGKCHTWNQYNTKGNRENQDFVDLNDDVLQANQASWDQPPGKLIWSEQDKQRARQLLQELKTQPSIAEKATTAATGPDDSTSVKAVGFKDPRTLLTLDGWRLVAPDMKYIGIFRHPHAVAASLANRNNMPINEAVMLWTQYNKRLLRFHRRQRFPIINFDIPEADFHRKLDQALRQLGVSPKSVDSPFYDSQLKHQAAEPSAALPWKTAWIYHRLKKKAC